MDNRGCSLMEPRTRRWRQRRGRPRRSVRCSAQVLLADRAVGRPDSDLPPNPSSCLVTPRVEARRAAMSPRRAGCPPPSCRYSLDAVFQSDEARALGGVGAAGTVVANGDVKGGDLRLEGRRTTTPRSAGTAGTHARRSEGATSARIPRGQGGSVLLFR